MKKILLVSTGGTIASRPQKGRLSPSISSEELLSFVPELKSLCDISTIEPFKKDSTNMDYDNWFSLSRLIADNYYSYDGFVITHGTDTMAYCSAALSYFIQNNSKPIVITGAQKSIYLRDTDARGNLKDAFTYACDSRSVGTHIVFDGEVILGTRARKTRTKSFNAFSSMDYPSVAKILDDKVFCFVRESVKGQLTFCSKIDTSVAVIKLFPGLKADILEYLKGRCKVLIIESFGVGGIPYYESGEFIKAMEALRNFGVEIIMTTQVAHEGSDTGVYEVGEVSQRLGLIEAKDMTLEAIIAKSVWILGLEGADFKTTFLTPVGADILY